MGRELRRVPANWQHPRGTFKRGFVNAEGYLPMKDQTLEEAQAEWDRNNELWEKKQHPDQIKAARSGRPMSDPLNPLRHTWESWTSERPHAGQSWWRPAYEGEPTHYQVYENTTEGTPVSPVLDSEEAIVAWLVEHQDVTFEFARSVLKGWLKGIPEPTMIITERRDD